MSTEATDRSAGSDLTPLDELCEEIIADDAYPDEIQDLAAGLLEAVEEGRLDATPG